MNSYLRRLCYLTAVILMVLSFPHSASGAGEMERTGGKYYELVDPKGKVIDYTGLSVSVGDEFIAPDNRRYKVTRIKGDRCACDFVGIEKMPKPVETKQASAWQMFVAGLTPVAANKGPVVGIYHTHSDESYVPSDGTASRNGNGGIYQVGQALRDRLNSLGMVSHWDTTNHNPHDPNAYYRSRRTAARLMKQGADVLIDVHRDSAPASHYQTNIKGTSATRVKLVVGRQNPHMAANMAFAKQIKAELDRREPGLAGGIFIAHGNYNQDLTSRAMLIEVGSEQNVKGYAQNGARLFARIVPAITGANQVRTTPIAQQQNRSNWGSAIAIVLGAGLLYGAYYFLNRRMGTR
ncbi:MAG: stage II sporulation protein P [Solirubrobacterales bacterium]